MHFHLQSLWTRKPSPRAVQNSEQKSQGYEHVFRSMALESVLYCSMLATSPCKLWASTKLSSASNGNAFSASPPRLCISSSDNLAPSISALSRFDRPLQIPLV